MIRPWYRSRLFWLGLPGLLFLLWAWGRSNVTSRWFYLDPGMLYSTRGRLLWYHLEPGYLLTIDEDGRAGATFLARPSSRLAGRILPTGSARVTTTVRRFSTVAQPLQPAEACWFPPSQWDSDPTAGRLVAIPYWLLTANYLVLGSGTLVLWQRRKARLLKGSSACLP